MRNDATLRFFNCFIDLEKRPTPRNLLHLMFDPEGMRPFIANWKEVAASLIQRVYRKAVGHVADQKTRELVEALRGYPEVKAALKAPVSENPAFYSDQLREQGKDDGFLFHDHHGRNSASQMPPSRKGGRISRSSNLGNLSTRLAVAEVLAAKRAKRGAHRHLACARVHRSQASGGGRGDLPGRGLCARPHRIRPGVTGQGNLQGEPRRGHPPPPQASHVHP